MALETGGVVALLLGSSVLSALINQAWTQIREHSKENTQSAFSALYVAISLESYASECASLIQDSTNFENSHGNAGSAKGNIAEFPNYPEGFDWVALGIKLTTKAMTFRVDVETTRTWFKGAWEFGDEDDIVPEVREQAALLGSKALALASELRRKHDIAPISYDDGWNIGEYLKTSHAEHVEIRLAREACERKLNQELWGKLAPPTETVEVGNVMRQVQAETTS